MFKYIVLISTVWTLINCEEECKANERHSWCKVDCPLDYCPADDNVGLIACDPPYPYPCPSGCVCDLNYLRLSRVNDTCVPAKECPAIKCTKPNEVFDSCPSNCLNELCIDLERSPSDCSQVPQYCLPKCVCEKGYYRNETGVCVPKEDCTKCPEMETYVKCKGFCQSDYCPIDENEAPVCEDPSPYCFGGCVCNPNYKRRSFSDNTCIPKEECPPPQPLPVLLPFPVQIDQNLSNQSHNIEKCEANERYLWCKTDCPSDYCPTDDNAALIACELPYPCPSGCVCELNHLRLSRDNDTCVPAKDCPPIKCTKPNEVYDSCPSSCLKESCLDLERPPSDCSQITQYCLPGCVCEKGYYRNETGVCVPKEDCTKCPENETYTKCKGFCQSDFCPIDENEAPACDGPSPYCFGGCVCNPNYKRRNFSDNTCIPAKDCPPPLPLPVLSPFPIQIYQTLAN